MNMNQYIGKICPYCKSPITEESDVVVCSVCEMPHHKDCWIENSGCTTFGCTGTISAPDNAPENNTPEETDTVFPGTDDPAPETDRFCVHCGSRNRSGAKFCNNCGRPIHRMNGSFSPPAAGIRAETNGSPVMNPSEPVPSQEMNPVHSVGGSPDMQAMASDWVVLIQTNVDYYMMKFRDMIQFGKSVSWNWSAFLFAPYWLLYRKMYEWGISVLGLSLLISFLPAWLSFVFAVPLWIASGIFGNYLYMESLKKKTQQMKYMAAQDRDIYLARNGGTNAVAVILAILVHLILIIVLFT